MKQEMRKKIILVKNIRADILRFQDACFKHDYILGIVDSQHVLDRLRKPKKVVIGETYGNC